MNKFLIWAVALLLLAGAVFAFTTRQTSRQGGIYNAEYNLAQFQNGLTYNKLSPSTFGISTTTPATFGAASGGFFTVSAGSTTFTASTTAVTGNTDINITQISTSTTGSSLNATLLTQLGNKICNTTAATSSPVVSVFASSTNPSLNGFVVTIPAPASNPACFSWSAQGY